MKEAILMTHVTFGVFALLATVWLFVETINGGDVAMLRASKASVVVAAFLWLSFLVGGYWYVNFYAPDKALILKGPWPFAHNLFMESKEHLFFILLLLGSFLPIAALDPQVRSSRAGRGLLLVVAGLIALLALVMEGSGAVIGLGVKEGLLAR
jgi:hypothetical protein